MPGQFINTGTNPGGKLSLVNNSNSGNLSFNVGPVPAVSGWSTGGAMITGRYSLGGAGTQNAALAFGGSGGDGSCTETYNGTSWTAGCAMIVGRSNLAGAGASNTAALAFGGGDGGGLSCTEAYNV